MALLYKTVCVLISGPIGSGKSTFGDILLSTMNNKGWKGIKVGFADQVKSIASIMGWDGEKDERGRKLLQNIGMAGRSYDQNLWVSYLINRRIPNFPLYPYDIVIIDDWRFQNEREYIEKSILYDVITLRMVRDEENMDNHISENSLPTDKFYYESIVYNTGDVYSLQRSAEAVSEYIIKKHDKGVK